MTLESTNVPSFENKAIKDGTAVSVKNETAIDAAVQDAWGKKVHTAGASASPGSTDLVMGPIFDKKSGVVSEGVGFGALDASAIQALDAIAIKPLVGPALDKFKSKAEDPSSAVERAIHAAQEEAARRVLDNPQWDHNFMRGIVASDRSMRAHPNLTDEIDQARTLAVKEKENLSAKEKKIDNMISVLKPAEVKFVNSLVNSEPDSKERATLQKFYPDIYQQAIERDKMINRTETANRNISDLQRLSDDAVRSRLDYATFLNRRGGRGDSMEMAHQLADIARIDPRIVDPYNNHPQFHDVRELARNLDVKSRSIFEEALSNQGIQPKTYFSPKFDLYGSKAKMVGKEPVDFTPYQKIQTSN